MEGILFYTSNAPLRYRARCFLEKRVIPAARKAGATAVVLLSAPEKAGELAEEALIRLRFLPY